MIITICVEEATFRVLYLPTNGGESMFPSITSILVAPVRVSFNISVNTSLRALRLKFVPLIFNSGACSLWFLNQNSSIMFVSNPLFGPPRTFIPLTCIVQIFHRPAKKSLDDACLDSEVEYINTKKLSPKHISKQHYLPRKTFQAKTQTLQSESKEDSPRSI